MSPKSSKPVLICAFGILAAFFMPWLQFLGAGMSGYQLGQLGSYGNCAWAIPLLAGAAILISFAGGNNRGIGAIAGIVPLAGFVYMLISLTVDSSSGISMFLFGRRGAASFGDVLGAVGQFCSIGVFLTLLFSIAIIVASATPSHGVTSDSNPAV
ncbi:MAG TPA: hypothetical protein VNP98_16880 [Chthoniobacterales bacterium]|nr:hypothetical protein [Chthoniobacterales bacterium]